MDWEKELKYFDLFHKPRKSSSDDSGSLYLGMRELDEKILILQYLPKYSKTSRHYHKEITERHIVLAGACYSNNKKVDNEFVSNPGDVHFLETKEKGCLMILEIYPPTNSWKKDKIVIK